MKAKTSDQMVNKQKPYPQIKISQLGLYDLNMNDIGTFVRKLHGLYNWSGIQTLYNQSGLQHVCNLWLTRNGYKNKRVEEVYLGDHESKYIPYWL